MVVYYKNNVIDKPQGSTSPPGSPSSTICTGRRGSGVRNQQLHAYIIGLGHDVFALLPSSMFLFSQANFKLHTSLLYSL